MTSSTRNQLNYSAFVPFDSIVERRERVKLALDAPFRALVNLSVAVILFLELRYGIMNVLIASNLTPIVFGLEICFFFLISLNTLYHIFLFGWLKLWMSPIQITKEQMELFRITKDELGFTEPIPKKEAQLQKAPTKSPILPRFSILPDKDSSLTPPAPNNSWTNKTSMNASFYTSTSSNLSFVTNPSPNVSLNSSWLPKNGSASVSLDESYIRKRLTPTTSLSTSIKDEASLRRYLRSHEEIEEKVSQMSEVEQQQSQNKSPFSIQKSKIDLVNVGYQPSDDSLIATNAQVDDNLSNVFMNTRSVDSICCRLNITPNKLAQWTENMKNWICKTILCGVVENIDKINETLTKAGLVTSLIGEVGLSALKQLSNSKSKDIPTLSTVLPYLELTIHQEYLINRLKDLSKRGLTDFIWNRGTFFKGIQWSEEWPTDALIIMHSFCTYMNSKLPSNPNYPEAKAFTGQYFRTTDGPHGGEKTGGEKVQIYILQTKVSPPHFNVVLKDDDIIEIPQGKNNVFYAIIVFLYFIKHKHYGFLGRVNLGPSGVNILCTIE